MLSLSEHNNAKSTEIIDAHGCCVVVLLLSFMLLLLLIFAVNLHFISNAGSCLQDVEKKTFVECTRRYQI